MKTTFSYEKTAKGEMKWMVFMTIRVSLPGDCGTGNLWGVGKTKREAKEHAQARFRAFRAAINRVPA